MFRSTLRRKTASSTRAAAARLSRLAFGTSQADTVQLPPVRALGPTLWCFTAASVIYLGSAAYEVRQDVKTVKSRQGSKTLARLTFDDIEVAKMTARVRNAYSEPRQQGPVGLTSPVKAWQSLSESNKMIATGVGLNTGLYGLCQLLPSVEQQLAHFPAGPRNYTLLTSTLGHTGLAHLCFNMYGLTQFAPPFARSRTIQGSGGHLTAFYLSSGIMAGLSQHLSAIWPAPRYRFGAAMGASGGIMAILGAFAMTYPNAGIGIILLPGSLPAQHALALLALFETYGLFVGFKSIRFGHGAHLGGLAIGSAYVYFDGNKRLWTPARRFAFNQMRRLNML